MESCGPTGCVVTFQPMTVPCEELTARDNGYNSATPQSSRR